jgi:membrane peptidoglycan carboxypeptidase
MAVSEQGPQPGKPPVSRRRRWFRIALLAIVVIFLLLSVDELRSSRMQAWFFARMDRGISYRVQPGASPSIRFPDPGGPYDQRLGYADLADYVQRLQARGYTITAQARQSAGMVNAADRGLFIPYREKDQGGLTLLDSRNVVMHASHDPQRIYPDFPSLPPALIHSLLYVENHTLLDPEPARRNPAVEWSRFGRALLDAASHPGSGGHRQAGGSTLATQEEKYRHSPDGRTASAHDKLKQMISASLRAYQNGEDTTAARHHVVLEYINTVPLAARPGFGEIAGIGDGMWAWYGRDFGQVNRLLKPDSKAPLAERALIYKEALSLFVSQRSPSSFLDGDMKVLEALTDSYLRLMSKDGTISAELCNAALKQSLQQQKELVRMPPPSQVESKGTNAVRNKLTPLLGVSRMYDMERLDLTVNSTLDAQLQQEVTAELLKLRDPEFAKAAGLNDEHLLQQGDPQGVTYSFTLIEKTPTGNKVRVQADNFDQPFDINEGTKLDLGSTSKLRTLVTYLEIITALHDQYAGMDKKALAAIPATEHESILKRWAIDYLIQNTDHALVPMLQASLERKYSASPGERFFTGGGMHSFGNFDKSDNSRILTIREGTQRSVNLLYIRLMRDVVHYYMDQSSGDSAALLDDQNDPRRMGYLHRFADHEGQTFLGAFYRKYQGKNVQDSEDTLMENIHATPKRLAAIFRSIAPKGTQDEFAAFVANYDPEARLDKDALAKLYDAYGADKFSLQDRGYLAGVHPLELWLLSYLHEHPNARIGDVVKASAGERQEVYQWLFSSHRKVAQDKRIKQLLEVEGFIQVHKAWKRLGYPFDSLVPSYASALGASADRPAALAELMGIIVNDGVRVPTSYIESLHFAAGTPYDTLLGHTPPVGERVLRPEIAQLVRQVVSEVVDKGTAHRVAGAFDSDDGTVHVVVGGKTGTGDNRFKTFARGGAMTSARVVSRSGAFVFYLGDHFYGTVVAYVAGPQAEDYKFTSALPVQILKVLAPTLKGRLALGGVPGKPVAKKPAAKPGSPAALAGSGIAATAHSGKPAASASSGRKAKPAATASSGHAAATAHSGKPSETATSGGKARPAATANSGHAAATVHSGKPAQIATSGGKPRPQVKPAPAAHSGKPTVGKKPSPGKQKPAAPAAGGATPPVHTDKAETEKLEPKVEAASVKAKKPAEKGPVPLFVIPPKFPVRAPVNPQP